MRFLFLLSLLTMSVWAHEVRVVGAVHSTTASNTSMTGKEYVAGAKVRLDEQEAESNEIGVFEFKKIATGKHTLVVEREGYVPARQEVDVTGGPLPFQIVVELTPRGTLGSGTVYISCRSRPVMLNQSTQWFRGRVVNGQDPLAIQSNPPLDAEAPHKLGDNPTTFDENVVMMLPESLPATRLHKVADPPLWLCFTPDGKALYTSYNNRLEVTDPVLHEAMASLPTEGTVGITACGDSMLATQMSGLNPGVLIVDSRTHTLKRVVPTPGQPSGAWLEGDKLYVSLYDTGTGRVACLSATTGQVLGEVVVGSGPLQLAAVGPHLLVVNAYAASISVLDRASLKLVATIGVGVQPQRIAISPDGRHALVTNRQSDTVSMLDLQTLRAVRTTRVGALPIDVAYSRDGSRAWVTCVGDGTVRILDGRTGEQLHATNPLPMSCPFGVAVKP